MPAASFGSITSRSEARLISSRIRKVLSTMAARQVRALLMGGQACVFYGAAEFSRDTDLLVLWEQDRLYWKPLRAELEKLRHAVRNPIPPAHG